MMKASLKEWHLQHAQNIGGKMSEVKHKIVILDAKAECFTLLDEEQVELHDLSVTLHSLARVDNSMNWQKSRMKWLQEGDANSKFFHGCINGLRHQNAISMVSYMECTIFVGLFSNIFLTISRPTELTGREWVPFSFENYLLLKGVC